MTPEHRRLLVARATTLAGKLSTFNEGGVNPSLVEKARRFLWTHPPASAIDEYLRLFAHAKAATLTRAEVGQAEFLSQALVREYAELRRLPGVDAAGAVHALATVLGWTARLMQTEAKAGTPRGDPRDRGPRGGRPGGYGR